MTISVLATGGTFDKAYERGAGVKNFTFLEESAVAEIIKRFGLTNIELTYDQERAKDSLDMDDADRAFIADWCATQSHPVIVHGTDTMINTARVIASRGLNKAVVITGALQSAHMRDTDAEFNLGGAVIAAQACPPGVYIVMNGKLFAWDECQKNPVTGRFESTINGS